MISTLLQYQMVTGNLNRSLKVTAQDPQVARESAYYLKMIGSIKSIDEFLENDRVYAFAMKAMGLEDMTYAKAFMKKALEGGVDKRDSFANRLADKRYAEFVKTFNFSRYGATTTTFSRTQKPIVDAYVRQTLEVQSGESNEAVRLALYFARKAGSLKNSYEVLADRALQQVVLTALGLPKEFAAANIDKQAAVITNRVKFEDFKDPAKLDMFLKRFATMWDLQNGGPAAAASPAVILNSAAGAAGGIGQDLLARIQSFKLGGF
ncbi:DUF1217 domain-containing protein [Pannonibacter tanglangensis]|uniref:DUF1217 domain-containing protein n=1 Tax=Pannonibacter tanglangensis TaxID=2750084 RepID=A0ABW9ZPD3_9HYPH|nr:DUF1217 domain-containing protein [Pannonibacter sp. XCT-34]NBN64844.1 DUF1217 domain-containing protein [Pannonibacter sp. XCT-34]